MKSYIKENYLKLLLFGASLILTYVFASTLIIQKQSTNAYVIDAQELRDIASGIHVGIVFGGGVSEDEPLPLVRDRLDTANELLELGYVDTLVLSGDNRSLDYNEPLVMYNYLVDEKGTNPDMLEVDFAGRSTYETCERARKIFSLERAILITESTHLPRAIYLCRHFDISAYGVISDGDASSGLKAGQRWREVLARSKAVFNAYVVGEKTILGDRINIEN